MSAPHPLTDAFIAERWPELDTVEGREEIRRQFDAVMDQVANSSWKPFPRFPDVMAAVAIEKARTLPDRLNGVKAALAALPPHWQQWQWMADPKPMFGERYVRSVVGDNGHGFGRQWIASVNATSKSYCGDLAGYIAAANPDTVSMMVARIEELEAAVAASTDTVPPDDGGQPFASRLYRTPYLVIPKLALEAMPLDWQRRFEALLREADAAGLDTPEYHVFREGGAYTHVEREDPEDEHSAIDALAVVRKDEWANYRRGRIEDVCPTFKKSTP